MSDKNKHIIAAALQSAVAAAVVIIIFLMKGGASSENLLLSITNAVSISALIYMCIAAFMFLGTTDFGDIFGYAGRKALHSLIPGSFPDTKTYYDYKQEKAEKRAKKRGFKTTLIIGIVLLLCAVILTFICMA